MRKPKTIRERLINKIKQVGTIDSKMVKKMFKDSDPTLVSSSKMKRVREMCVEGLLKRTSRGVYEKTKEFDKKFS